MGASLVDLLANYNPSGFAQNNQLRQQAIELGPAELAAKQQEVALRQQQVQAAQTENVMRQRALRDQDILQQAMQQWDGKDPAQMLQIAKQKGLSPPAYFNFQKNVNDQMAELVTRHENELKLHQTEHEAMRGPLAAAMSAPEGSPEAETSWQAFVKTASQYDPDMAKTLPTAFPGRAQASLYDKHLTFGDRLVDEAVKKQQASTAATVQQADEQKMAIAQRQQDASALAAAATKGADAVRTLMESLPYGRAKVFEGAQKPQDFLQLGQTPEQVVQTTETARHNKAEEIKATAAATETARHNKAEENLKRIEVDPFGMFGAGGGAGAPAGGGAQPAAGGGPHGDDFLKSMPPALGAQVKALAEGKMAFPAGFALKSPYWQAMISRVAQYDPSFDAVNYNARSKTRNAFTSGKEAQQVNALNTAIGHLGELADVGEAVHQGNIPLVNSLVNKLASAVGDPSLTNFKAVRDRVVDEVTRLYRGTGGAESDVKRGLENFSPDASPEQRHGAIKETVNLMRSKMDALEDQYKQGMGTTTQGLTLLNPKAKAVLDKVEAVGKQAPAAGNRAAQGGYQVGHKYGGLEYLGGDPNQKSNWK
jgi:hypothetical protein